MQKSLESCHNDDSILAVPDDFDPTMRVSVADKVKYFKGLQNYAVKFQSKLKIVDDKKEKALFNEIDIMCSLDHPMLLKLVGVA